MKKIIVVLVLLICSTGYSQEFVVTKQGLRDASNVEKDYVVINVYENSNSTLYINSLNFLQSKYSNPEEAIKAKIENKYVRYETYIPQFTKVKNGGVKIGVSAKYTIELKFKEGKVKYSVIEIELGGITWQGSMWKGYPIWNKKGKLRLPETKEFIENFFNAEIKELSDVLNNKNGADDNW